MESPAALSAAQNRGLTEETLKEQLGRLGNTPYELAELSAEITGSVFAPVSLLNRMRREAVEEARGAPIAPPSPDRFIPPPDLQRETRRLELGRFRSTPRAGPQPRTDSKPQSPPSPTASLWTIWIFTACALPSQRVKAAGVQVRVASPRILKPGESRIVDFLVSLQCPILVRSTGILHTAQGRQQPSNH